MNEVFIERERATQKWFMWIFQLCWDFGAVRYGSMTSLWTTFVQINVYTKSLEVQIRKIVHIVLLMSSLIIVIIMQLYCSAGAVDLTSHQVRGPA